MKYANYMYACAQTLLLGKCHIVVHLSRRTIAMGVNQGGGPPHPICGGWGTQYQKFPHLFDHLYHEAQVLHGVRPNPVSHHGH